jgi:hypothetical protein
MPIRLKSPQCAVTLLYYKTQRYLDGQKTRVMYVAMRGISRSVLVTQDESNFKDRSNPSISPKRFNAIHDYSYELLVCSS